MSFKTAKKMNSCKSQVEYVKKKLIQIDIYSPLQLGLPHMLGSFNGSVI